MLTSMCSNIPRTNDMHFVEKMVGWSYYNGTSFNIFEELLVLQRYSKLASVQLRTGMLIGITALKDNVNEQDSGLLPQAYNICMHLARLVFGCVPSGRSTRLYQNERKECGPNDCKQAVQGESVEQEPVHSGGGVCGGRVWTG